MKKMDPEKVCGHTNRNVITTLKLGTLFGTSLRNK